MTAAPRPADANYERVLKSLKKGKCRPVRRATLANHIRSVFQKNISEEELERLIILLFAEGKIVKRSAKLSYTF